MDDTKEKSIGDELKEDEFHEISPHSHRDALWSCVFCGLFGTHRYLVGRWGDGMAALNVLCWIGAVICGITLYSLKICLGWIVLNLVWWGWDLIRILLRRYSDGKGRSLDENDDGTYSSWEVCTDLCAFLGWIRHTQIVPWTKKEWLFYAYFGMAIKMYFCHSISYPW